MIIVEIRHIFIVTGLALGFATKDFVSNLVGGCLVFLNDPFQEGAFVFSMNTLKIIFLQ